MSVYNNLLRISSEDKTPALSVSNSNFVVQLTDQKLQNATSFLVKEIKFMNNFYNVRNSNRFFTYTETGQPQSTINIAEGQYLLTEFISALQTSLNADLVSGTVVITQDPINKKLIFTFTGTTALFFNKTDGNLMASIVGILNSSTAPVGVYTADDIPDLTGVQNVYLHSRSLAISNLIEKDGLFSVFESVCIDVPFGAVQCKTNSDDELAQVAFNDTRNIQRIDIKLRTVDGELLDLRNQQVTILLKVFF